MAHPRFPPKMPPRSSTRRRWTVWRSLGIERYEISNFARRGHESLHNLKYWRMSPTSASVSDAHSFDGCERRENIESAQEYVDAVATSR